MERPTTYTPVFSLLLLLLLGTSATITHAQKVTPHSVDLAKNMDGQLSESVNAGLFTVVIKNKLPGEHYDIKCIKSTQEIDAFPLDAFQSVPNTDDSAQHNLRNDPCAALQKRVKDLAELTSESVLADTLAAIQTDLDDVGSVCNAASRKELLEEIRQMTAITLEDSFPLTDGEILTIVVSREIDGKLHTWTHVLSTRPRGRWYVTYGFSFVTDLLDKEETYFAKQQPDTTLYTVTKKNAKTQLTFVPCLLVNWIPTKSANQNWVLGLTGGLGFDLENPVVFLGFSGIYNTNLGIHIGLAARKQNRLNGVYSPGDTIKENLTEDQLNEKVYAVNPFISLSFRFKSSPFATH